jgi:hypothetical protein
LHTQVKVVTKEAKEEENEDHIHVGHAFDFINN